MSFRRKSLTLRDGDGLLTKRRSSSATTVRTSRFMNGDCLSDRYALGSSTTRQARVLFDYDAISRQELSARRNEIVIVYRLPGMDDDFVMAENGVKRGRIPFSYVELI